MSSASVRGLFEIVEAKATTIKPIITVVTVATTNRILNELLSSPVTNRLV